MNQADVDKKPISRRKLLVYLWTGAGIIALGELVFGTLAFLWPRRRGAKGEKIFIAGEVDDFKIGEIVYLRKEKAFVGRMEEGFLAFSSVCPHLACVVNWNEKLKIFECPCHGAKFDRKGEVTEGPPPRPLDLYKLQIVQGKLVIDTAGVIERKQFDPSQVVKG